MKRRIFFISLSLISIVFIAMLVSYILPFKPEGEMLRLDGEWEVDTEDIHLENVSVDEVSDILANLHDRDVITLSYELPENEIAIIPTIMFESKYSAVEVSCKDMPIYTKWVDRFNEHKYIGVSCHFVPIPMDNSNNIISIKLYVSEDGAYNYFNTPVFGSYHDVQHQFIRENLLVMAVACFLIVFGISFIFITVLFYKAVPNILGQLLSSIMFLDLGVWIGCFYRLASLFFDTTYITTVELVALYVMVPLSILIFGSIGGHYKISSYRICTSICGVITLLLIVFHLTNLVHLNRTLNVFYIVVIATFIMIVKIAIGDHKKATILKTEMLQDMEFFVFGISTLLNTLFYNLEEQRIISGNVITRNVFPVGVMMYIYLYLLNYFLYITEMYAQNEENKSLTRLAYADGLTNIPNRSMWTKRMNELKELDSDYCIISMDLNGLKDVNDRLGHAFGDAYIVAFAKILKETFKEDAFIARIGGDEFVVVLENTKVKDTESYIYQVSEKLNALNAGDDTYRRSVAAGYAYKSELTKDNNSDPQNVYLLADKRMYDVKRHMHYSKRIGERLVEST